MKIVYETFEELARAMTKGEGMLHIMNCPGKQKCGEWQQGVQDFAGWLDHIGATVNVTDAAEDFYDYIRTQDSSPRPRQ